MDLFLTQIFVCNFDFSFQESHSKSHLNFELSVCPMQDQSSPSPVEEEEAVSQEDEQPMFLTRRQNSVPGGRSLTQTGHEATIIQGSPFIYCGAAPGLQNTHRRLAHHNSMRSPSSYERNNNTANGGGINNNNNGASSSRRLKRHDTDPSMGKSGRCVLLYHWLT